MSENSATLEIGSSDELLSLNLHPVVMILLGAAYCHGYANAPVRGFGAECYGKSQTLGDDTWNALVTSRDTGKGYRETGIILQHNKGRWSAQGGKMQEYWIPFEVLDESETTMLGATKL